MGQSEIERKRVGKHAALDTAYVAKRKLISEAMGPQELWSAIDHWGLFTGTMTLARNLAFIDMIRSTLQVPGDVVEFGSWKGATLMLFAKMLAILDPHGIKVVHGFSLWDQGFTPEQWGPEDNPDVAEVYKGTCNGELQTLEALIDLNNLSGSVALHNGDILELWPAWLSKHPNRLISLAYFDCDLFEPTQAGLQGLHERLAPGAMVGFDQCFHADFPGEGKAAMAFLDAHPGQYEMRHVVGARQPEMLLVRR